MSSMRDRDYIQRIIKQLADGLARALKLRRERKLDEALQALGDTSLDVLGVPRDVLDSIDPRSAAAMLGDLRKVRHYARLLVAEAGIREELGEDAGLLRERTERLATLGGKADAEEEAAFGRGAS